MYATLHNPGGEQTVTKQIWFPALLKWDLACTTSLVLSLQLGTHWQVTHCTTHWYYPLEFTFTHSDTHWH